MNIKTIWAGVVLSIAMAAHAGSTNDLAGALRNGLFQEQVDHNLEAAIATYQSVVTKFDTDRQLAATAAFRLGECYRALGKTNEAVTQYQRVLTDFSDQATLVKLSEQNLTDLRGGLIRPPMPPMPPADYTNDFNARLQAIVERSRAQSAQDRLAELQAAYAEKSALLGQLKNMSVTDLKQQLTVIGPDAMLMNLMDQLNVTQQKLIVQRQEVSTNNPSYNTTALLVEDLQEKVDDRISGILKSKETELAVMQAQMDELKKVLESTKTQPWSPPARRDPRTTSPEEQAKLKDYYQSLAQPSTDEEQQEIQRIRAMIENSPDLINAAPGAQTTPLMTAAVKDELLVAQYLLEHGADVDRESFVHIGNGPTVGTPLHAAAENGHKKMVELLIGAGADVNARAKNTEATPLICAANRNYPAVAEVLLAHGADPNRKDNSVGSPLNYAARNPSTNLAALLLAHGAEVNATNDGGFTPLHTAAGGDRLDLVTLLLDNKADVNARTQNGMTPLHIAAAKHKSATVRLLLGRGAEVNARDEKGETALVYAAREGAKASAEVLLAAGADPNLASVSSDHPGWTALHHALQGENVEIAEALLSHGAKPNLLSGSYYGPGNAWMNGTTPLMLAIGSKSADVGLLLRYKADPNQPDSDGVVPLQVAIRQTNIVDALLRAGADVNRPFKNGFTPLQWAVNVRSKGAVETLLSYKPDVNAINQYGVTALDLTRGDTDSESRGIATLLRAHGALDNVPKYDVIQVSRPSAKFATTVFKKGTNDWNHFTLLELIAVHYGFISTSNSSVLSETYFDENSVTARSSLKFPDLREIKIWRPTETGLEAHALAVNVEELLASGDCSKDVELKWGDVVEIPEVDHPIDAKWDGLTGEARRMLRDCLKRSVQLTVKGQTTNLVLAPVTFTGSTITHGPYGWIMWASTRFSLWPVLSNSGLLRTSSDLARVRVTRTDTQTGKKRTWTVDCSNVQSPPDFWLRDGDVVEVGEK